MTYKCPLCGGTLTQQHYHNVIKVQERQDKVQKGALAKLQRQTDAAMAAMTAAKRKQQEIRARSKTAVADAKKQVILSERRKTEIRHKRLMSRIKKLEDEKHMLQKHTSPQEIGLADESVLVSKLRKEFPSDRIEHAGKGGDVLHYVVFNKTEVGSIVYECKHTDRISSSHVAQAALAKKTRQASYAMLVTTGTRRGFSGLDQDSGVLVVAQAGVLTLARICRDSLVTMAKQQLDAAAKAAAATRLMDYVTSPTCRTPLEEAIAQTDRAQKNLIREIRQHLGDWKERHDIYQTIHYDVSHIQRNVELVLEGAEPIKLEKPKLTPLALPAKQG